MHKDASDWLNAQKLSRIALGKLLALRRRLHTGRGSIAVRWMWALTTTALLPVIATGQTVALPNPGFEQGAEQPEGWRMSQAHVGVWEEDATADGRVLTVLPSPTPDTATWWQSEPTSFEADAVYSLIVKARRNFGQTGAAIAGSLFWNRDLWELSETWRSYESFLVAPSEVRPEECALRLGQWNVDGAVSFDQALLTRVMPVYRRQNEVVLGEGESIAGNLYRFEAPLSGASTNHARPLAGYTCTFNKPRWCFSEARWVKYRHETAGVVQQQARIEATVGHHVAGRLRVEVSTNNRYWQLLGEMDGVGMRAFEIPERLFPVRTMYVRFTGAAGADGAPPNLQLHGYVYQSRLDRQPGDLQGATRFIRQASTDGRVDVLALDLGEALPDISNTLSVEVVNRTAIPLYATLSMALTQGDEAVGLATGLPVLLPPARKNEGKPVLLELPYVYSGVGAVEAEITLGDVIAYSGKTTFNVSPLFESRYGWTLPASTNDVGLWWCSSGWKISQSRALPTETSSEMTLRLAQNEWESAQFVVRPQQALKDLRIVSGVFRSETGVVLPDAAVRVCQVGYVPVSHPTDELGAAAPWPDPLPPLEEGAMLRPGINHPFWVTVHAATDCAPGIYRGAIELSATGWSATVPMAVEVFGFALPDVKRCVTAFGFSPDRVFDYHGLKTPEERRMALDLYLQMLSDHHISPYVPAALDPMTYAWPRRPDWRGGSLVSDDAWQGTGAFLLYTSSGKEDALPGYHKILPLPEGGVSLSFVYKTVDPGRAFFASLRFYDAQGNLLRGEHQDTVISGAAAWTEYALTVDRVPAGATGFTFHPWVLALSGSQRGEGVAYLDALRIRAAQTGELLLEADFEPLAPEALTAMFTPEFDWTAWDAAMTRALDHYHFNSFQLHVPGLGGGTFHDRYEPSLLGYPEDSVEYQAAFTGWCQAVESHLREKGWLDKAFVYWFDEPDPKDYDFVKNGFRKLKTAAPGIRRMLTEQVEEALVGGPDIWCPLTPEFDAAAAEARRAAGDQFWWYVCTAPKAPYATLFIDHPATELRVWLWQTWQRRIDGILIWETNYWHSPEAYPDRRQNPYEDPMGWTTGYSTPVGARRPWGNGDGRFVYPPLAAANGRPEAPVLDPPVASIRLAMLRDGIEDYEYLVLLRDLLAERGAALNPADREAYAALLDVPESISASLTQFTFDPAPMEAHREAAARAIEALIKN